MVAAPAIGTLVARIPNYDDRATANARLIAAAPELLAMLERVLDGVLRLPELPGTLCPLDIEQALAAIAKAKGGAQ